MLTKILLGTKRYKSASLDLAPLFIKHFNQLTEDFYTAIKVNHGLTVQCLFLNHNLKTI